MSPQVANGGVQTFETIRGPPAFTNSPEGTLDLELFAPEPID